MINGLSLFTGIGGIDVALSKYVRPIVYCEIDPYCQSVILSRMQEGDLPKAPIWDDIRTFQGSFWSGDVDIIYGGFPCQGISVAGLGKGLEDERSGLFFEIMRLAKEIKPRFIFLENVPAITSRGGLRVVREIASMGYDCRWCIISAASVGAMHRRKRWFLLAHSVSPTSRRGGVSIHTNNETGGKSKIRGESIQPKNRETCSNNIESSRKNDSNPKSKPSSKKHKGTEQVNKRGKTRGGNSKQYWPFESRDDWQKTVSEMGKCTDGLSYQVDRLKSLGNAVVPIQVTEAFDMLMGIK